MPYASSTAIAAAHSCTRSIGAGAVSRLATSASITSPWEIHATGRTGHNSSTISAIRSRRPNSATTGSAPSRFSSTRTTATSARARPRPRPVLDIPLMPDVNQKPDTLFPTRYSKLQTTQQSAITQPPHASNLMCEDRV